jgi:hypothetical protein
VKLRRSGSKTTPSGVMPVIFPDDPGVADTIGHLMGWQ